MLKQFVKRIDADLHPHRMRARKKFLLFLLPLGRLLFLASGSSSSSSLEFPFEKFIV